MNRGGGGGVRERENKLLSYIMLDYFILSLLHLFYSVLTSLFICYFFTEFNALVLT